QKKGAAAPRPFISTYRAEVAFLVAFGLENFSRKPKPHNRLGCMERRTPVSRLGTVFVAMTVVTVSVVAMSIMAMSGGRRMQPPRVFGRGNRRAILRTKPFHLDSQRSFELEKLRPLLAREKRGSNSMLARAPSAADAMNKVLGDLGKIEVDDVRDVVHV